MVDLQSHQNVVDNEGNTTSVLIPVSDYEKFLELLKRQNYLDAFERELKQSVTEMQDAKAGKSTLDSFQSLIDEL